MGYKFLAHTAEVKFKARGKTLEKAFEAAALAFSELVSKGTKIKPVKQKKIKVRGNDLENLLYNFIEELIFLLDAENFVIAKTNVKLRGNSLEAQISGDSASNYSGLDHVKAATYSEMHVRKTRGKGWEVQAVLDV